MHNYVPFHLRVARFLPIVNLVVKAMHLRTNKERSATYVFAFKINTSFEFFARHAL